MLFTFLPGIDEPGSLLLNPLESDVEKKLF
jgi:hypothetical protein